MNKNKKLSLRLGLFAGLISIALLGSTAGSLAWYAYSRNVTISYVGTSVATSALLNIGLVDNDNYFSASDLETYNLEEQSVTESSGTNRIVWSKSRTGFSLEALHHYLDQSPHATDKLRPVTTGSRAFDDSSDLLLYRSPEVSEIEFDDLAEQDAYTVLPFAFRIIDENSEYVSNKSVWLTESVVDTEQPGLETSVRVYVDGANKFLMQPYLETNSVSSTKVGGILALGPGGYYDRDTSTNKEYCYGEFENTPVYSATGYSGPDELVNVNGVSDTSEQTTFLAKHFPGVLVPDIDAAVPKVQTHAGIGKIKPSVRPNGELYHDDVNGNGYAVATTSESSKVGYASFTIFVEGWDHAVIDQNANYSFNLGLKFEIDRI